MSTAVGWVLVTLAALPQPIGKVLIKYSYEAETNKSFNRTTYRLFGNATLMLLTPILHVLAYYYGPNAFIPPVVAAGVLINIVLAWWFLDEGAHMGASTIWGALCFCLGLFSVLWAYSSILTDGDLKHLNDDVDWGVLSLFMGFWIWGLTLSTIVICFTRVVPLSAWCVFGALCASLDIVGTYDKWIFSNATDSLREVSKGVLASLLYAVSTLLSIFIINRLLSKPENPVHIVATMFACISLGVDASADLFVFQRYKHWVVNDWTSAIGGLALMFLGIWFMNRPSLKPPLVVSVPVELVPLKTTKALHLQVPQKRQQKE
tara:strand:- start:4136 stop:5092 length:957 start_codon:yes stop_codon:yes gene_type:complete